MPRNVLNGWFVEVFTNSLKIGEVGTASPDPVDQTGRLPTDPGYAPDRCEVGLADATMLTPAFEGASANSCADLNGNQLVTLADVVIFTPHAKGVHGCAPLQP